MASKIKINLDTSKELFLDSKCKQNDDLTLEANIYENGLAKDLTNCSISIQALKADKTYVIQNTDITKSNNKFIANLVRDFTRVAGKTLIEVVLTESGKQNTTFSFYIEVVGSVIKGAVESNNTVTILENLQDKIEEAGQVKAETEQLIATGGAATKGDIATVNSHLEQKANKDDVAKISSGTPLFAPSTMEMTDTTKNYVNTTDGYLYIYSDGSWISSNVKYQEMGLSDGEVEIEDTNFVKTGVNKFNKNGDNKKGYYNSSGELTGDDGLIGCHTHLIRVNSGDIVRYTEQTVFTNRFKGVALNGNKEIIKVIRDDIFKDLTSSDGITSFTISFSDIKYISLNYATDCDYNLMVTINTVINDYIEYETYIPELNVKKIDDNIVSANNTTFLEKNINIFNKETVVDGYYKSDGTILYTESVQGKHSDFIEVNYGDVIKFTNVPIFTTNMKGYCFDSNKKSICGLNVTMFTDLVTNDNVCSFNMNIKEVKYISFNLTTTTLNDFVVVKNTEYPTNYVEYGYTIDKDIKVDYDNFSTELKKYVGETVNNNDYFSNAIENVLCIGDSLTKGQYWGGDSPINIKETYPFYLGKMLNANVTNSGVSGITTLNWYENESSKYIYSDYDTFIVFLGTNGGLTDTLDDDVVGTNYEEYADTNTGCYCKIIEKIKNQNPNAFIILINLYSTSGSETASLDNSNITINKIAEKYNLKVIDIKNTELGDRYNTLYHPQYQGSSNIHFGKIGNLELAKLVNDNINQIVKERISEFEYVTEV